MQSSKHVSGNVSRGILIKTRAVSLDHTDDSPHSPFYLTSGWDIAGKCSLGRQLFSGRSLSQATIQGLNLLLPSPDRLDPSPRLDHVQHHYLYHGAAYKVVKIRTGRVWLSPSSESTTYAEKPRVQKDPRMTLPAISPNPPGHPLKNGRSLYSILSQQPTEIQRCIRELSQRHRVPPLPITSVYAWLCAEIIQLNRERDAESQLKTPSQSTFKRIIRELEHERSIAYPAPIKKVIVDEGQRYAPMGPLAKKTLQKWLEKYGVKP